MCPSACAMNVFPTPTGPRMITLRFPSRPWQPEPCDSPIARETPDALARPEFSDYELEAIFVQRKPKGFTKSDIPKRTLAQAIRWIADTAGYTGPLEGPSWRHHRWTRALRNRDHRSRIRGKRPREEVMRRQVTS